MNHILKCYGKKILLIKHKDTFARETIIKVVAGKMNDVEGWALPHIPGSIKNAVGVYIKMEPNANWVSKTTAMLIVQFTFIGEIT